MAPLIFSFRDISSATNDFSGANRIGSGGYGIVYSGSIDGKKVAVKVMDEEKLSQNPKEFRENVIGTFDKEIKLLSACDNENIISLVGYCIEGDKRFLAYELMAKGSLYDYLMQRKKKQYVHPRLTTIERLRILIGAAKGIEYLHSGTVKDHYGVALNIIHGDVKADNILLDDNLVPKVADFGLSKPRPVGPSSSNMVTRNPLGTPGYAAPECNKYNYKPSRKADVYAFGVVILEMLCEKPGWKDLVLVARVNAIGGNLEKEIPQHVEDDIYPECLRACETVIRDCLENDPDDRPEISHVRHELEIAVSLQKQKPTLSTRQQVAGQSETAVTIPEELLPGFMDCVVVYHTSNGIISKTQELCQQLLKILYTQRKRVDERDVYLNGVYKKQFKQIFGSEPFNFPQVFIGGKHVEGGVAEIIQLNVRGELKKILERIPKINYPLSCDECQNTRFVSLYPCENCCSWKIETYPEYA